MVEKIIGLNESDVSKLRKVIAAADKFLPQSSKPIELGREIYIGKGTADSDPFADTTIAIWSADPEAATGETFTDVGDWLGTGIETSDPVIVFRHRQNQRLYFVKNAASGS